MSRKRLTLTLEEIEGKTIDEIDSFFAEEGITEEQAYDSDAGGESDADDAEIHPSIGISTRSSIQLAYEEVFPEEDLVPPDFMDIDPVPPNFLNDAVAENVEELMEELDEQPEPADYQPTCPQWGRNTRESI
ncbi:hypothetical protein GE061_014694 [Apolygus lucorum]|uniref:Uncharacterized protein n=1 Tax=Apolygus lucorum TaxID=248454 RepID=A0A8S9XKZ3_APOLU|nr:hypothetical protein GE061_014694 [Apolygus lucorum]